MKVGDYVIVSLESNLMYCIKEKVFLEKKEEKYWTTTVGKRFANGRKRGLGSTRRLRKHGPVEREERGEIRRSLRNRF